MCGRQEMTWTHASAHLVHFPCASERCVERLHSPHSLLNSGNDTVTSLVRQSHNIIDDSWLDNLCLEVARECIPISATTLCPVCQWAFLYFPVL